MGPIAKLLIFLLRLCPSVTMVTPTEATQAPEACPDFIEDDPDLDAPDDWPSQEALENHMTLAFLEHCMSLPDYITHDD